eukprot:gene17735-biopygen17354
MPDVVQAWHAEDGIFEAFGGFHKHIGPKLAKVACLKDAPQRRGSMVERCHSGCGLPQNSVRATALSHCRDKGWLLVDIFLMHFDDFSSVFGGPGISKWTSRRNSTDA